MNSGRLTERERIRRERVRRERRNTSTNRSAIAGASAREAQNTGPIVAVDVSFDPEDVANHLEPKVEVKNEPELQNDVEVRNDERSVTRDADPAGAANANRRNDRESELMNESVATESLVLNRNDDNLDNDQPQENSTTFAAQDQATTFFENAAVAVMVSTTGGTVENHDLPSVEHESRDSVEHDIGPSLENGTTSHENDIGPSLENGTTSHENDIEPSLENGTTSHENDIGPSLVNGTTSHENDVDARIEEQDALPRVDNGNLDDENDEPEESGEPEIPLRVSCEDMEKAVSEGRIVSFSQLTNIPRMNLLNRDVRWNELENAVKEYVKFYDPGYYIRDEYLGKLPRRYLDGDFQGDGYEYLFLKAWKEEGDAAKTRAKRRAGRKRKKSKKRLVAQESNSGGNFDYQRNNRRRPNDRDAGYY